jgi:hypothetical protein
MRRASVVLVGIILLLTGVSLRAPVSALTINSPRDCDSNAVIHCGALNFTELENRSSQAGVAEIYSNFGISMQDINNMRNGAVKGVVTNKNNVWIHKSSGLCPNTDASSLSVQNQTAVKNNPNLCLVATNAMTAGRQNISGSTAASNGGVTFYKRAPSVSFASSSLPAFVVMKDHRFAFAVIASCGNPVVATPVTVVTPQKPAQTKTQTQTKTTPSATATANATATVKVTPSVQAATTTQPAVTKSLPNTGPGNILMLSGVTSAIGTLGHYYYTRRSRRH